MITHYNNLWQQSLQKFEKGLFELDPLIDSPLDDRFGLTLLLRPNQEVQASIQAFLKDLENIEPHQYYYPETDLHVTVMSIISCYSGFNLSQVKVADYVEVIGQSLHGIPPFDIAFRGITASPSCILIQGFPVDDTLEQIRNALRTNFKATQLEQTLDKRYRTQTAHSTVIRFRQQVKDKAKYIEALKKYRSVGFGASEVSRLELVCTDWYQRVDKVQVLHTFLLPRH